MADELQSYNKWSSRIRLSLLLTGLLPSENPSILYRMVVLVHGLASLSMSCLLLNFSRHNATNLHLFFKGLGLALSFITVLQKMICLTIYRKQLVELHASLEDSFVQDLKEPQLRSMLLAPMNLFYRPSVILSLAMSTSIVIRCVAPLILVAVQYFRNVDAIKLLLPFPTVYPWNVTENWLLRLSHYVYETYAGSCLLLFSALVDSLFGYYVFQICGQLRILSYRITNVKSTENYCEVIRHCVARHVILIRCQKLFECIYGPIVLWMLMTNSIHLCGLAYQLSRMGPKQSGPVIILFIIKSLQTLNYALFGTFLTTESDMFREAIYASNWAGSSEKSFMTDVLIMITQKPMVTVACSISTISANMFAAVCNATVSYFFVIRTLEAGSHA